MGLAFQVFVASPYNTSDLVGRQRWNKFISRGVKAGHVHSDNDPDIVSLDYEPEKRPMLYNMIRIRRSFGALMDGSVQDQGSVQLLHDLEQIKAAGLSFTSTIEIIADNTDASLRFSTSSPYSSYTLSDTKFHSRIYSKDGYWLNFNFSGGTSFEQYY